MDDRTNNFLELAYDDEETMEHMFVNNANTWKYTWNFADLTQKRWWWDGNAWECVKTRSIRRVQVLAAPSNPRG